MTVAVLNADGHGIETFLSVLFPDGAIDERTDRIEVRVLGDVPRKHFARTRSEAIGFCERQCEGENYYVGVAVRGNLKNERGVLSGAKDNCVRVYAAWVDVDGLTDRLAHLSFEARLAKFPLKPTLRVFTGGGEHVYFAFLEPLELDARAIQRFEAVLRGLSHVLGGDRAATDASRILRVVGTTNYPNADKIAKGRTPALCHIVAYDPTARYAFGDLESRFGAHVRPRLTVVAKEPTGPIAMGARHDAVKRRAAALRKQGLSGAETLAALQAFNAERCEPPLPTAELEAIAQWFAARPEPTPAVEKAPDLDAMRQSDRLAWMRECLRASLKLAAPMHKQECLDDDAVAGLAPRWPSSLGIQDAEFYGMTVVAGEAGTGKSMLAIASAAEAAAEGWRVVYVNSELDAQEMALRVQRTGIGRGAFYQRMKHRFHVYAACEGVTVGHVAETCAMHLVDANERLLIVLDSINSIAELGTAKQYQNAALDSLSKLSNWVTQLRRLTLGEIAVLVVSELNAGGTIKGRKLTYSADLVLSMANDQLSESVEMKITKARSSPRLDLGLFRRDWVRGRFERQ